MDIIFKEIDNQKDMANGKRNLSREPLTEKEIVFVKSEIVRIGAEKDMDIFIFNDPTHLENPYLGTGYNYKEDKIYITMNVFPDDKYASVHPRDLMSVGAVLAHEYYGHRPCREEYLQDDANKRLDANAPRITPEWQDECRASINASKLAKGLTDRDKQYLILDAIYRAKEYGQYIENDDYMKGVLYGNYNSEKPIIPIIGPIKYVSAEIVERDNEELYNNSNMPEMSEPSEDDYERE